MTMTLNNQTDKIQACKYTNNTKQRDYSNQNIKLIILSLLQRCSTYNCEHLDLLFHILNLIFLSDKYLSMKKDADWSECITLFFTGCWCNYISKLWWSGLSFWIYHQLEDLVRYHNISLAEISSLIFWWQNTSSFLNTSHFFITHLTIFDGPHLSDLSSNVDQ